MFPLGKAAAGSAWPERGILYHVPRSRFELRRMSLNASNIGDDEQLPAILIS